MLSSTIQPYFTQSAYCLHLGASFPTHATVICDCRSTRASGKHISQENNISYWMVLPNQSILLPQRRIIQTLLRHCLIIASWFESAVSSQTPKFPLILFVLLYADNKQISEIAKHVLPSPLTPNVVARRIFNKPKSSINFCQYISKALISSSAHSIRNSPPRTSPMYERGKSVRRPQ